MSCDVTKLEYLNETKQMLREKIDPEGKNITEKTPFRDYVNMISNNCTAVASIFCKSEIGTSFIIEHTEEV